jgi:hypothetical protein
MWGWSLSRLFTLRGGSGVTPALVLIGLLTGLASRASADPQSVFAAADGSGQLTPGTGSPGVDAWLRQRLPHHPHRRRRRSHPLSPPGHVALAVAARYGRDAPQIAGGLIWRVYAGRPDTTGVFPLIKEEKAAAPTFVLGARQLCRACELRTRERGQGRAAEAPRPSARYSISPPAACASRAASATVRNPRRANLLRHLQRHANSTPPTAGRWRRTC